jgi:hypothetical protein
MGLLLLLMLRLLLRKPLVLSHIGHIIVAWLSLLHTIRLPVFVGFLCNKSAAGAADSSFWLTELLKI